MSRYMQVVARFTATIDPNYNYGKSIDVIMSGYLQMGQILMDSIMIYQ